MGTEAGTESGAPFSLRDPFLDLRHPLEGLQVRERLRSTQDLGRAERQQELLRTVEATHPDDAGSHALQDMGVRSCTLEQSVLPREPERLVVEGVAQEPRVLQPRTRRSPRGGDGSSRVGNGMKAIERMREIDEAALLADRLDRVGERHATRDLFLEEEPDHLALIVGLDLLAGDDDEVSSACELDGLERATEDVVIGDGDAAETDLFSVVEQVHRGNRAVVRPVCVEVQIDRNPVACGERSSGAARGARRLWASFE